MSFFYKKLLNYFEALEVIMLQPQLTIITTFSNTFRFLKVKSLDLDLELDLDILL